MKWSESITRAGMLVLVASGKSMVSAPWTELYGSGLVQCCPIKIRITDVIKKFLVATLKKKKETTEINVRYILCNPVYPKYVITVKSC